MPEFAVRVYGYCLGFIGTLLQTGQRWTSTHSETQPTKIDAYKIRRGRLYARPQELPTDTKQVPLEPWHGTALIARQGTARHQVHGKDGTAPTLGAVAGDGETDDTAALERAVAVLTARGVPGILSIPAGTFRITRMINISAPIVLRGAGRDATTLFFPQPLSVVRASNHRRIGVHCIARFKGFL